MTGSPPIPDAPRHAGYLAFASAHRRFLGFGFTLTFFSSFGQSYFISTFGGALRETFHLTPGEWGERVQMSAIWIYEADQWKIAKLEELSKIDGVEPPMIDPK